MEEEGREEITFTIPMSFGLSSEEIIGRIGRK